MNEQDLLARLNVSSLVDILLVALVFLGLFYLVRGTRAVTLLRGILLVAFFAVLASTFLNLTAFNWLTRNSIPALLVAIPVIFQPELRRAFERLGRPRSLIGARTTDATTKFLATLSRASGALARQMTGALMIIEGKTGLQEYIDTGVKIDAEVSADLLLTIFNKHTDLHDGAVILRDERILAASCMLPLSENPDIDRDLGTRHRAALGVSESTDAIAIVVSEETGGISVAHNGRLIRNLDEGNLNRLLTNLYTGRPVDGTVRRFLSPLRGISDSKNLVRKN
ncbi:MAG: TIGR00159 family protein [Chloroflexota bacterium]|nr:MAG: TIGR00159 family protein [Chloroflexota bacterium]